MSFICYLNLYLPFVWDVVQVNFTGESFFINTFKVARTQCTVDFNRCTNNLACQIIYLLTWLTSS